MLHLIFQTPLDAVLLDRLAEGDVTVFMENAVLYLLTQGKFAGILTAKLKTNRFCVLADEIAARGILPQELVPGIEIIDYPALVKLTVENKQILTWS